MASPDLDYLTTKDLARVRKVIWNARLKWRDIGIELEMDINKLNKIKETNLGDTDKCFTDMLTEWLNQSNPTWTALTCALMEPPVGHEKLAREIENSSYCQTPESPKSASETEFQSLSSELEFSVQPLEDTSSMPRSPAEKENLEIRLRKETSVMIKKFSNLILNTKQSLKEQERTPSEVACCVLSLGAFDSEAVKQPLLKEDGDTLRSAKSVDEIFCVLPFHMSFLDYGLLSHIIANLGTDEDCRKLQKYEADLKEYCKRKVFEIPQNSLGAAHNDAKTILSVKLTEHDKSSTSLEDVVKAKGKIASILGLTLETLHIFCISSGCIQLDLSLPTFVFEQIIPIKPAEQTELVTIGAKVSDDLVLGVKTIPSLGRPFRLGMLYDSRSDSLLDKNLLESTELKRVTETKSHIRSDYEIILEDTIDSKCAHLGIDPDQKLSLMSGLIRDSAVSGSARFFYDCITSQQVARISVMYKHTKHIEQLNLVKAGEVHYSEDSHSLATHVVVGVVYGVDAMFILNQTVEPSTTIAEAHSKMHEFVEDLVGMETMKAQQEFLKKCHVNCFGDLHFPIELNNLQDAFRGLPTLTETTKAIPKSIFLCPLNKIVKKCPKLILKQISFSLITQVQILIESLCSQEIKVSDLMKTFQETLLIYKSLQQHLTKFKFFVGQYKRKILKQISSLLPKVRGGSEEESVIEKVLHDFKVSPFSEDRASTWLKQKTDKIKWLSSLNKDFANYYHSFSELETILHDIGCVYVVCLVVNAAENDEHLQNIQMHLNKRHSFPIPNESPSSTKRRSSFAPSTLQHDRADVTRNTRRLRHVLRQFKSFAEANSNQSKVKFVVVDKIDEIANEGTIVLYNEGILKSHQWIPPGPPGKPQVTNITSSSVQISWERPQFGSENVTSYEVLYCSQNDRWKLAEDTDRESVLVIRLDAKERYTFKIRPKCEVGVGHESEISEPIETYSIKQQASIKPFNSITPGIGYEQHETSDHPGGTISVSNSENEENGSLKTFLTFPPGKPTGYAVSYSSIKLKWSAPEFCSEPVQSYSVLMSKPSSGSSDKEIFSVVSCEAMITGLAVNSKYRFKIQPVYKCGIGATSEESDPIATLTTSQPLNVIASNILHNSVQLSWEKPEHGSENIKFYTVLYRLVDVGEEWKKAAKSHTKQCIVEGLDSNQAYFFKVRPECETADGDSFTESEEVGPIRISPPEILGKSQFQTNTSTPTKTIQLDEEDTLPQHQLSRPNNMSEGNDSIATVATSKPIVMNLKVSNVLHNSIQLTWEKPEYGSEDIEHCKVLYHLANVEDNWKEKETLSNNNTLIIKDLEIGKKYNFKVQLVFRNGDHSIESEIIQKQTKTTSPPKSVNFSEITDNSAVLKWTKPDRGSEKVDHYKVLYKYSEHSKENWMEYETIKAQLKVNLTGLCSNMSYLVKVCAVCPDGEGAESYTKLLQTEPFCKPGKPGAKHITHNSVHLVWTKPEYGSEVVQKYAVCSQQQQQSSLSVWKLLNCKLLQCEALITGLNPQTLYYFKVRPLCDVRMGTESDISGPIETLATTTPGKPKPKTVSHNSVELKWTPSSVCNKHNNCITSYTILYRPESSQEQWNEEILSVKQQRGYLHWPENLRMVIPGLNSETNYVFKVRAECKEGKGAVSDECIIKTKTVCKPGKPNVTGRTHNTITLKWQKPKYSEWVINYVIHYCNFGAAMPVKWEQKQIAATDIMLSSTLSDISYTVSGLDIDTKYIFKVRPVCKRITVEDSEVSDEIETCATSPPGKPTAIYISITYNTIHLQWERPVEGSQNIQSYTVTYSEFQSTNSAECETTHDKESIELTNLKVDTKYKISVRSNCKTGKGCESPVNYISTKSLCQPGKPKCSNVTHETIALQWDEPRYDHEKVEHYVVHYKHTHSRDNKWQKFPQKFDCNSRSAEITGLIPGTSYTFAVYPVCKPPIKAIYSISDEFSTRTTSKPGTPIASRLTSKSLVLQWREPLHGSGSIKHYTIICKETGPDQQHCEFKTTGKQEQYTVKGLYHQTEYAFTIRPECEGGPGCESKICTAETLALSKPGKPRAIPVSHSQICLEWEYYSEDINSYLIFFCEEGVQQWDKVNEQIKPSNTEETQTYVVNDLNCATKYRFKVKCDCSSGIDGESAISDAVKTKATSPPSKPTLMSNYENSVTHESIGIRWGKPSHGIDNVARYDIHYCSENAKDKWLLLNVMNTLESVSVPGLSPGTKYMFKVCPVCSEGEGTESDISDPIETKVTSQPGKPTCVKATHNSIQLQWENPTYGSDKINDYVLQYYCENTCTEKEKPVWVAINCNVNAAIDLKETKATFTVIELTANTCYKFKVLAKCNSGNGSESELSNSIYTEPLCCPGTPHKIGGNHTKIELEWKKPEHFHDNVVSYDIIICCKSIVESETIINTKVRTEHASITGLESETGYYITVKPECNNGDIGIECSKTVYIETESKPLAEEMKFYCQQLTSSGLPALYLVPMLEVAKNTEQKIAKYDVGFRVESTVVQEKVLMLVGATGAGKTTLINGLTNYVLNTQWKDEFRFQLIQEKEKSQAHSQTMWITAYTFYPAKGSRLTDYKLTVIDTPGFGDTEGIEMDKKLVQHIKEFFSIGGEKGIDQIHGIGFVIQATNARLTATQRYIFDQMLALFGNDIAKNIFLMITYANVQKPPVLIAVKEADLPYKECYKFDNLNPVEDNRESWTMGVKSFKDFFDVFNEVQSQSLTLTREVLNEREQLEICVQGLHQQLKIKLDTKEELRQVEEALEQHKTQLKNNLHFEFMVTTTKIRRVNLDPGRYVTNCEVCMYTCHTNCSVKDSEMHRCIVMKSKFNIPKRERCLICPGKCSWKCHKNEDKGIVYYRTRETRTSEEIKKKYDTAKRGKDQAEHVAKNLKLEIEKVQTQALLILGQAQKCLNRLHEIALRPIVLSEADYIDLLIISEKQRRKVGFVERITHLEDLRKQAKLLLKVKDEDEEDENKFEIDKLVT